MHPTIIAAAAITAFFSTYIDAAAVPKSSMTERDYILGTGNPYIDLGFSTFNVPWSTYYTATNTLLGEAVSPTGAQILAILAAASSPTELENTFRIEDERLDLIYACVDTHPPFDIPLTPTEIQAIFHGADGEPARDVDEEWIDITLQSKYNAVINGWKGGCITEEGCEEKVLVPP